MVNFSFTARIIIKINTTYFYPYHTRKKPGDLVIRSPTEIQFEAATGKTAKNDQKLGRRRKKRPKMRRRRTHHKMDHRRAHWLFPFMTLIRTRTRIRIERRIRDTDPGSKIMENRKKIHQNHIFCKI